MEFITVKTNRGDVRIPKDITTNQVVRFYSKKVFNLDNKPVKNQKQKEIYQIVYEQGLGSHIVSITGPGLSYHINNDDHGPGLIQIKDPNSYLIIPEICPKTYDIMLEKINKLHRDDILIGCGDFYDVISAFHQEGYIQNQLTFLDLDFCASSKTLIETTQLLRKLESLFAQEIVANNFALTVTYSTRKSPPKYHDNVYIGIQRSASKYKFRIPNRNSYNEIPYNDVTSTGHPQSHMRTIFGRFVKDKYTQQFPGYFRYGESFIL